MGNLRETEISISLLGIYGKYVRFPKIAPTKKCGEIPSFFAVVLWSVIKRTAEFKYQFIKSTSGCVPSYL